MVESLEKSMDSQQQPSFQQDFNQQGQRGRGHLL